MPIGRPTLAATTPEESVLSYLSEDIVENIVLCSESIMNVVTVSFTYIDLLKEQFMVGVLLGKHNISIILASTGCFT